MPIDRSGDPWPGATYKGFSGAPVAPPEPPRQPARRRRRPGRALMIGGIAAAVGLGLLFGFLARPELIGSEPPAKRPPAPAPTANRAPLGAAQVPIAVNPPQHAPPPRAAGKLETLPPEMAAAARTQVEPHAAAAPVEPAPPVAAAAAPQPAVPQVESAQGVVPAAPKPSEPAPAPTYRTSFDCATARPGAEEMVCSDPALAAADRQMAQAYRRALRSGVAPEDLRQEQRDWMAIREDAARYSHRALSEVYDQRIQELNQIADEAPGADE